MLLCVKTIFWTSIVCQVFAKFEDAEDVKRTVEEAIKQSMSYSLPKNNSEYFENYKGGKVKDYGNFDFIIVGAGTTGGVVATRLSEVGCFKVLVLEAGNEETKASDIPSLWLNTQFSKLNWGYYSSPQSTCCLGMVDRQCIQPVAKGIGGGTLINAIIYSRGNKEDYNKWEKLGNPGWSYNDVLPYFKKSEHNMIPDVDPGYHGVDGPWNIQLASPDLPLYQTFHDGSIAVGKKYLDFNGAREAGFHKAPFFIKNGRRDSIKRAFVDKVRDRRNLNITTNAFVTQILINKATKEVQGVEFIKNGEKWKATAIKEVIISGGAINTPQILKLSGIGPRAELDKLRIPVVEDLPVGKHLKDHIYFLGLTFSFNETIKFGTLDEQANQFLQGKGPLTTSDTQLIGFVDTLNPKSDYPDIEYILFPPYSAPDIFYRATNVEGELLDYMKSIDTTKTFRAFPVFLHPKSEGEVTLKSKNPQEFPKIDVRYFSDSENHDIDTVYRGIQFILNLTQTEPFKKINATLIPLPICKEHSVNSKEYWYCAIRQFTTTLYHQIGTAKMGPKKSGGVVDHELKVYGLKKLRVADCSIFPEFISGHTTAAAVMIGEKVSDMIKKDHS